MDNLETSGFSGGAGSGPTGSDAAAILLMMLGDSEAAEILSYLEPDEVQHLGSAMFNVADVSETQVEGVFNTFMTRNKASRAAVGGEIANAIADRVDRGTGTDLDVRVSLEMIEATRDYEARAALIRAFVRQDPARAALVVRDLIRTDGEERNG